MGYEFFGEKITFPSTPVLGINNDQSLMQGHGKQIKEDHLDLDKKGMGAFQLKFDEI